MKGTTSYRGISKIYFHYLLSQIISIASLNSRDVRVLDFGCGTNKLKEKLGKKVVGFDIVKELSDVLDWRVLDFEVVVANHVFYSLSKDELESFLKELGSRREKVELVVGTSRQGFLNNLGKNILGRKDAHAATKISPRMEVRILLKFCKLIKKRNVLFLSDIYWLELN